MIQLANFEEREFYIDLGEQITACDLTLVYQMTEESFLVRLTADKTNDRATKFSYTATNLPEGQYLASFAKVDGTKLVTVAAFVTGDPIFATSQYNTYNDDGTSTTYVPSDDQGLVPSVSQRLRVKTENDVTDVHFVRTINVTDGTLTDDGNGAITLDTGGGGAETLNELTDVDIISPDQGDVLSYNSGVQKWMVNGGLQELLARFKASGTGAQVYDTLNDTTKGYIDILANSAKMKVNLSGLTVTEASPGVMSFSVAAGTEGNEVEFEAMTIEGSDAVSTVADINFKQGSLTYWENSTGKIWLRAPNAGNITVLLPSSGGTLALTTDIPNVPVDSVNGQTGVVVLDTGDIDENGNLYYTEARVAANAAVAANTAKVGITTQQAADITANNAKVGITPTQAGEITANTAKVGVIAGGTSGQALVKASGTDYDLEWADAASGVQYHERFATDAETFRSGATATTELYYTAKADGDGLAQSASSDTPTAGKVIRRKIYYSEAAFADPDTGTWVEFTPAPADDASFATVKAALLENLKARTGGTVPISLKQTWEEVTAAPAFTGLLNESYGSGAAAAYGTRRLNGNYSGACMTIRRASDGTTQTIGFVGEEIDESAITTFCTGTTCTVQTWHDQSQTGGTGSGNDATQTDSTKQPTIYTGGALVKDGGRLALDFDGTDDELTSTTVPFSGTTHRTSFTVSNADTATSADIIYGIDGGNASAPTGELWQLTSETQLRVSGRIEFNNSAQTIHSLGTLIFNGTTVNDANFYLNGSLTTQGTSTGATINTGSTNFGIGTTVVSTSNYDGKQQELIFYASDKSTDRTSIEGNISAYYQSAKLLDTYSGAAAAYSLRLLDSTYTGSAIRVRRSSDNTEQDIGFNVFGELDTVSLLDFAGTGDAFVKTWYCQSGNSNDATQTNTANQPRIVSSGAVEVENGKPIITRVANYQAFATPLSSFGSNVSVFMVTNTYPYRGTAFNGNTTANFALHAFPSSTGAASSNVGTPTYYVNGSTASISTAGDVATTYNGIQAVSSILSLDLSSWNSFQIGTTGTYRGMYDSQEFIIWDSDQSSNRANIESNINTFYSIT
jgi:hypothetical protein